MTRPHFLPGSNRDPGDSNETAARNASCAHCGLTENLFSDSSGVLFCCHGCQTVYSLLHASGVANTFYRLRGSEARSRTRGPAITTMQAGLLAELDSPDFLESHCEFLDNGVRRTSIYLDGVHCAACVWLVEQMPIELTGVRRALLDLGKARLTLEWRPDEIALSRIGEWLGKRGYAFQPRVYSGTEALQTQERSQLIRAGVAWALAGNLMLISFALYSGLTMQNSDSLFIASRWLSLLLTVPVLVFSGRSFFVRAVVSIAVSWKRKSIRNMHMDTPIAVGLSIGFLSSVLNTIRGTGEIWFDSIAVLVAALLTARWLHLRSRRIAGSQSDQLLALVPTMARALSETGRFEWRRVSSLVKGEYVEVFPGEVIPVDGIVSHGESYVDNAILSGESRPENVLEGDEVWAGATNTSQRIVVRTIAAGDTSRVGGILSWINRDASSFTPSHTRYAWSEQIGGYFVATVLLLAAITFSLWASRGTAVALQHVIALLVITCPCALAMAVPLAKSLYTNVSAKNGLFIRNDDSLDTLIGVDTVVFDKTGTLTEERQRVVSIHGNPDVIRMAAVLEAHVPHPIAESIREYARAHGLESEDSTFDPTGIRPTFEIGNGVYGHVCDQRIFVGRPDWVAANAPVNSQDYLDFSSRIASTGATPVAISVGDRIECVLAIGESARRDASGTIKFLKHRRIEVLICSGDHPETVRRLGERLGIPRESALGGFDPDQKTALIANLKSQGKTVAMIGDGVNDAAALRLSDVGIAVGGSTMAGRVSSDVFLTGQSLSPIRSLFLKATDMQRTIHVALIGSLGYNLLGAAAAMSGWVSPLVAAVAMPISSILVVSLILVRSRASATRSNVMPS